MRGIYTILLPALAFAGLLFYANNMAPDAHKPYGQSALAQAGDTCDLIAEKAAIQLPEALPFQRLEKTGRQARVMDDCMHDRAYVENPEWVLFAKLQAEQEVRGKQISVDEAYENLRRKYMLIYQAAASEPIYWLPANAANAAKQAKNNAK